MVLWMSITLTGAIFVYRDKALETIVTEESCLNKPSEMLKIYLQILVDMIWLIVNIDISDKTGSERFTYFCIEGTEKNEGKYQFFNGRKNTYIKCMPETQV